MKQAILIMYHEDYNLLLDLLKLIDNNNFDIYLHIDKKVKDFDYENIKKVIKKSKIYFTRRLDVRWGTLKQIECELLLLKEASKNHYKYYHLISGVDLPIKKIEEIYNFFDNKNQEFVGFTEFSSISNSYMERVKYYHLFNNNLRSKNKFIRYISTKVYYNLLKIQKKLGINRLKNINLEFRKGPNWFSITDDLASYVLSREKEIKKIFKHTHCCDELFLQTIVYNSEFKNKVYKEFENDNENTMRLIDWVRGEPYVFLEDDFDLIKNSKMLFARKFSSKDNKIIEKIVEYLKEK